MIKLDAVLNTDGSGYWSTFAKSVNIVGFDLVYVNDERDFGELRVYFDTASWDVNEQGLIYTDKQFIRELGELLNRMGYAGDDISYSEQGMQGDNFVSLDVFDKFINSYLASLTTTIEMV